MFCFWWGGGVFCKLRLQHDLLRDVSWIDLDFTCFSCQLESSITPQKFNIPPEK